MEQQPKKHTKRPRNRPAKKPARGDTTLACLIAALEGKKIVVELRHDVIIRGMLDSSDDFMNLTMSKVSYQTVQGSKTQYESMYVKGRNIRFVHLPRSVDPAQLIEAQRSKLVESRIAEYKHRQQMRRLEKEEAGGKDAEDDDDE